MKLYKIRKWNDLFENNRSRTVKDLSWVAIPNRHDGENFTAIITDPNGAKIFSAWVLILQVASRCQPRGTLLRDDGTPHNSLSLARKTRAPEEWFILAFDYLEQFTDWIEVEQVADKLPASCQRPASVLPASCPEGNGIEVKEGEGIGGETPPPPAVKEKAEPETPSSDYQAFVDAWFHAYKEVTDGGYLFNKRYDPAAVKSLLTLKQPPVEIIRLAVWAWKNNDSYCQKKASSIHGFCEHYPELLAESKMPPKTMSPSARKAVQDGIKTVREAMLKLPANPESTLFSASRVLTPSQITEFKDMRQKLADLERQITA